MIIGSSAATTSSRWGRAAKARRGGWGWSRWPAAERWWRRTGGTGNAGGCRRNRSPAEAQYWVVGLMRMRFPLAYP